MNHKIYENRFKNIQALKSNWTAWFIHGRSKGTSPDLESGVRRFSNYCDFWYVVVNTHNSFPYIDEGCND